MKLPHASHLPCGDLRVGWICARILALWIIATSASSPLLALDPAKSVFQFNVQNWSRQNGLPAHQIAGIIQTRDGYIWLATQNGLVRFDGLEFQGVPITLPQARNEEVRSVCPASNGGIWFANNSGGFGYYDGRFFSALGDARWSHSGLNATAVLETKDGKVWTATERGVGYWIPGQPQDSFLDEEEPVPVLSLCEDRSGRVWRGTSQRGVAHWEKGKWIGLNDPTLEKRNVFALASDGEGNLWVGTDTGLRCYDERGTPQTIPPLTPDIRSLLVDHQGILWVGTMGLGLARYNGGAFSFLKKEDGLGSDSVTSLHEDNEGSLWVGTRDGLSQLTDLKFPIFTKKDGYCDGSVHSVSAARDGGLWISSSGLTKVNGRSVRSYREELSQISSYIISAFETQRGEVYIADGDKNLAVLSPDRISAHFATATWARGITEDAESPVVGLGPILSRVKNGQLIPASFPEGQAPTFYWINNIVAGRDGALLISSNNGVCRLKDGAFQTWSTAQGLPDSKVNWITEDPDGTLWAGLLTGLVRIKQGRVFAVRKTQGLFDERIYAIIPDDHDNFWISSGRGIMRIARRSLNDLADGRIPRLSCDVYDGLESLKFSDRTDQEPSGCRTQDGRIWFPNPQGVVMIDPDHFFVNTLPPPVYIQQVRIDGEEVKTTAAPRVKPGSRRLEFSFTALSYISPKKIQIRYQLEGIDAGWVDAGPRRSAQYTNLKPGQYTFRVQAGNADGIWNLAGDSYQFQLPPTFAETPQFIVCCLLAGGLLVFGGFRWKVRHMEAKQKKLQADNILLETKVAERTAELAREHALLRALLDYSPDQVYFKDTHSRFFKVSRSQAVRLGMESAEKLIGKTDFDFFSEEHARAAYEDEREILRTGRSIIGKIEREVSAKGEIAWVITSKMALRNGTGQIVGTFGTSKDITPIKEAEAKLDQIHKELMISSRQAGMAEVATNVLHNVGNVLNSVNVSASLVAEQVRNSRIQNLGKLSDLLAEKENDLAHFIGQDPRGRRLPAYIKSLWQNLVKEQSTVLEEISSLCKNIQHIKDVVSTQQAYAKVSGVTETLPLLDLLEDALKINSASFARQSVSVVRDFQARPTVTADKHKVIQILVNLINNAGTACRQADRPDKIVTLQVREEEGRARITISDNGVGIPPENLTQIFAHGFTTKVDGHGFGLHSGALAAKEIGGSLQAHSEGVGRGAVFTLELPLGTAPAA